MSLLRTPHAIRRTLAAMSSHAHAEAEELRESAAGAGATHIETCVRGEVVTVSGILHSVTLQPRAGVPATEAVIYDGTGYLTAVWLGRRRIAGISAGRGITVHGRITCDGDMRTIFNPKYELLPRGKT
ncbi:MAG: OB-fold nucleic acid binding domain-containing protein [Candidatus Nanopelagicales bacterium]|nr:OB-fold nucleic acid binding domain-containing protein [Candidatus Nanopelagicales bacterium]